MELDERSTLYRLRAENLAETIRGVIQAHLHRNNCVYLHIREHTCNRITSISLEGMDILFDGINSLTSSLDLRESYCARVRVGKVKKLEMEISSDGFPSLHIYC